MDSKEVNPMNAVNVHSFMVSIEILELHHIFIVIKFTQRMSIHCSKCDRLS